MISTNRLNGPFIVSEGLCKRNDGPYKQASCFAKHQKNKLIEKHMVYMVQVYMVQVHNLWKII